MAISLKTQNRPFLALLLILNIAIWYGLTATGRADPKVILDLTKSWQTLLPAGIGAIIVGILTEQFSPVMKARLVFWRWKDPLPGARAFTKYGPLDPRVDMAALRSKLGALPTDPMEQNQTWYRLYKAVQEATNVSGVHKEYLFLRDYTCLAVMLLLLLPPLGLWLGMPSRLTGLYAIALLGQYLLVRNAASGAGKRMVTNVLASAS